MTFHRPGDRQHLVAASNLAKAHKSSYSGEDDGGGGGGDGGSGANVGSNESGLMWPTRRRH